MITTTQIVIAVTVAGLVLYDVIAALIAGRGATISWVTLTLMRKWPIIALAVGVVVGHIAWPNQPPGGECAKQVAP